MFNTPSEIVTVIISGTLIFLVLVFFIVSFLLVYQKKQLLHLQEKEQLKLAHERAIQESQLEIQEQTLREVGRELHDNIGQILSLVKLHLHDTQNPQQVGYAKDLVSAAITDVRTLSKTLNTDWAEAIPLPHMIRKEVEKIERSKIIQIEFLYDEIAINLESRDKLIVFRVFQECVNNIIKHAAATYISVNLYKLPDQDMYILEVADNGQGFDLTATAAGSGLVNMRRRMETIKGRVDLNSRLNSGTRVELQFPVHSVLKLSNV